MVLPMCHSVQYNVEKIMSVETYVCYWSHRRPGTGAVIYAPAVIPAYFSSGVVLLWLACKSVLGGGVIMILVCCGLVSNSV